MNIKPLLLLRYFMHDGVAIITILEILSGGQFIQSLQINEHLNFNDSTQQSELVLSQLNTIQKWDYMILNK